MDWKAKCAKKESNEEAHHGSNGGRMSEPGRSKEGKRGRRARTRTKGQRIVGVKERRRGIKSDGEKAASRARETEKLEG